MRAGACVYNVGAWSEHNSVSNVKAANPKTRSAPKPFEYHELINQYLYACTCLDNLCDILNMPSWSLERQLNLSLPH